MEEQKILKETLTMTDNINKIYSTFDEKRKQYTIESDWQVFGYCNTIDEMNLILTCISFHGWDDIEKVIKWAKYENKRVKPFYSHRGEEYDTPACRFNIVFDCVCNRMNGLKPKSIGKGNYMWIK